MEKLINDPREWKEKKFNNTKEKYDELRAILKDCPISTYAKFSEKLTFLTPCYAHVGIRGLEM